MSAADRIAEGIANHLFECRPTTAKTRGLIEEEFRRGHELARSLRLPIAQSTSLRARARTAKFASLFHPLPARASRSNAPSPATGGGLGGSLAAGPAHGARD